MCIEYIEKLYCIVCPSHGNGRDQKINMNIFTEPRTHNPYLNPKRAIFSAS